MAKYETLNVDPKVAYAVRLEALKRSVEAGRRISIRELVEQALIKNLNITINEEKK